MDVESAILQALSSKEDSAIDDSHEWAKAHDLDAQAVVGAIKSLLTDAYVTTTEKTTQFFEFTSEANEVISQGSPEFMVWKFIQEKGVVSLSDLEATVGKETAKNGMGNAMKFKWIKKEGDNLEAVVQQVTDEVQQVLQTIVNKDFEADAVDSKVCLPSSCTHW